MKCPYLLGQIGLVGNSSVPGCLIVLGSSPLKYGHSPYLLGQIGLVGNNFGLTQKYQASALPIRSNRISWKLLKPSVNHAIPGLPLPIRSNRISWKAEKGFLKETLFLINCVKYILTKIDKML